MKEIRNREKKREKKKKNETGPKKKRNGPAHPASYKRRRRPFLPIFIRSTKTTPNRFSSNTKVVPLFKIYQSRLDSYLFVHRARRISRCKVSDLRKGISNLFALVSSNPNSFGGKVDLIILYNFHVESFSFWCTEFHLLNRSNSKAKFNLISELFFPAVRSRSGAPRQFT